MRTAFLAPDDPGWSAALAAVRHDFYHLPAYVRLASRRQETGEPVAYVAEDADSLFFIPLILRPLPSTIAGAAPGSLDATSSRGYPGPIAAVPAGPEGDRFLDRAIAGLTEALRARRVVSAFVRLHPLRSPQLEPLRRAGAIVDHGDSVSIDLAVSDDAFWRGMRENHRRDIRRATANGYRARIDEGWSRFDGFVDAYAESMRRLGADEAWSYGRDYLLELREALASLLHLCVVEVDGELAAAALLTEEDGIVEYHLAGTYDRHIPASPSKLIIDFARRWARERGDEVLHLAGSLRRGDPLGRFKLGFSRDAHPVFSWRLVTDPAACDALSAAQGRLAAPGAETGYFPPYREPRR
jgi:hypothetical protein